MNSQNQFNIMPVVILQPVREVGSIVGEVFESFNFHNESGLLQFWACSTDPDSEEIGCNLVLTGLTRNPTQDQGLEDYRSRCLGRRYPFVGIEKSVGNWSAGRAAQTGIADHRTKDYVVDQDDQHSADVGARGLLVLPVFFDEGTGNKLAGVIEYVTNLQKESYVEDFEQIHNLLKDKGLKSTYMGKTIKAEYVGDTFKFRLPLSSKFADLHTEVMKRFPDLEHKNFCVRYEDQDNKGIVLPISSDEVLRGCLKDSSSKGANFIKMHVSLELARQQSASPPRTPRRGKKAIGKKTPAKRWTDEEEVALAKSWLTISENPDVGNTQKKDGFYRKVTDHFHQLMNDNSRTLDQIYSKWNNLNSAMKKWNGFYQQASMNRKSGEGDKHVFKKAMKDYKSVVKSKGFPHIQAWELVRYNSLWCDFPLVGCHSQSTTKRPKPNESMGSANAQINLDDDEDVEGQHDRDGPHIYFEPDRPTRKGKRSAASSSSYENLIQQMAEFNSFKKEESQQRIRLREEKLRVLQEEKDARIQLMRRQQQALDEQQKAVDLEFMMKDHTIYQEPMLQLILDRKREIVARWGWRCPF